MAPTQSDLTWSNMSRKMDQKTGVRNGVKIVLNMGEKLYWVRSSSCNRVVVEQDISRIQEKGTTANRRQKEFFESSL